MAQTVNAPTLIGITQQLAAKYWAWSPDDAKILDQGADAIVAHVVDLLTAAGCEIVAAYGIVHDRDERLVWNEVEKQQVLEPKPRHIHMVIKFASRDKSLVISHLARVVGLAAEFVEKPGRGRYAQDNMLSYLTHAKYPDKFQYAATDVATVLGRDYQDIDAERRVTWLNARGTLKTKNAAEEIEPLLERALTGQVTVDEIMMTDSLFDVYARHKRMLDEAFESYGQRRATRAAIKLRDGVFKTSVFFITGSAGVGKTHFAVNLIGKQIQDAAEVGETWSVYRAATSNPLDNWNGEEVLLLDDLRAAAMTATDWLLLLDPENSSPASARYKNKQNVAPRLIVITASIDPVEFFSSRQGSGEMNESMDQFMRRLTTLVTVYREDDIRRYVVDSIGKVEGYSRYVDLANNLKRIDLTYGSLEQYILSNSDEVMQGLLSEVASRSCDLGLTSGEAWSQANRAIEAPKPAASNNPLDWVRPGETAPPVVIG